MSWLRRQGSFRLRRPAAILKNADPRTLLEAVREHCTQACSLMQRWDISLSLSVRQDVVAAIINHLEQTVNYILEECATLRNVGPTLATGPPSSISTLSSSSASSASAGTGAAGTSGLTVTNGASNPPGNALAITMTSYVISPILDHILDHDILEKILQWSLRSGEFAARLLTEQLRVFEILASNCSQRLLYQKTFLSPLQKLLSNCETECPEELEHRLVALLNTICVTISQNTDLLQIFYTPCGDTGGSGCNKTRTVSSSAMPRFPVFSLLVPFVHREGSIGQQARDALLLCLCLAAKNHARLDELGFFMANHSTFCPVLATGLSGLYSALPRKLIVRAEDWCRFSEEDIQELPALGAFLCSLEFCNAVTQVSHHLVREQLLDYLLEGFLKPVMAPALYQSNTDEIMTTTAYLELFLRRVTEPRLLRVFLHFLTSVTCERRLLLEILILRIGAHSKLATVTLSFFRTLLDLNCEDVMFELIFKYLWPCSHIMTSHRDRMRTDVDTFCVTAQRLLSLAPSFPAHGSLRPSQVPVGATDSLLSVVPLNGSSTFESSHVSPSVGQTLNSKNCLQSDQQMSYLAYLFDAKNGVRACRDACQTWSHSYDGERTNCKMRSSLGMATGASPVTQAHKSIDNRLQPLSGSTSNDSIGTFQNGGSVGSGNCRQAEEREDSGIFVNDQKDFGADVGPFLTQILSRLESLPINDVYTNLQLTALVSRLALYPQPLLRSFLLSQEIVFQPSVRSLYQVLCTLRQKLDQVAFQLGDQYKALLRSAHNFFSARDAALSQSSHISMAAVGELTNSTTAPQGVLVARSKSASSCHLSSQYRRRSFGSFFRKFSALQPIADNSGYRYIVKPALGEAAHRVETEIHRAHIQAVLSIVVFEEFVKELAAISQEHCLQHLLDEVPPD